MKNIESINKIQKLAEQMSNIQSRLNYNTNLINNINNNYNNLIPHALLQIQETFSKFDFVTLREQVCLMNEARENFINTYGNIDMTQFSESLNLYKDVWKKYEGLDLINNIANIYNNTSFLQATKLFENFQPNVIEQYVSAINRIPNDLINELSQMSTTVDISSAIFSDNGTLTYNGVTYTQEEVARELEVQIEDIIERKSIIDNLKEKYNLLKIIFKIFVIIFIVIPRNVSTLEDSPEFYRNKIEFVSEKIKDEPSKCYVIKEQAYLRSESNAKSKILKTLIYDTELEIIEVIPRWYHVKYTDETGVEQEGWISKISVEE